VINRRTFLGTLAGGLLSAPLAAEAQPTGSVRRIGFLSPSSAEAARRFVEEFERGLRERGYVEGQNLHVEYRWAEGKVDRLPGLVTDLITLGVELIVAQASPAARAAHQATRTIPIVMVGVGNPVELGLAASLAHPGGNVTGLTSYGPDLTSKQLELLREAVPHMKRLAVLWTPANPLHPGTVRDLEELTRSRGIQIQPRWSPPCRDNRARGGGLGRWRFDVHRQSRADRHAGDECAITNIVLWARIRRSGRPHVLRSGREPHVLAGPRMWIRS
jgi:putative ABC transport system substrate-binding protein